MRDSDSKISKISTSRGSIVLMATAVSALVVALWWVTVSMMENALRQGEQDQLRAANEVKVRAVVDWRQHVIHHGTSLGERPGLAQYMEAYLETGSQEDRRRILAILDSLVRHDGFYQALLVSPEGDVLLSQSGEDAELHPHAVDVLALSISSGSAQVTSMHRHDLWGWHLDLVAPIFPAADGRLKPLGAVILLVDPTAELFPLIDYWPLSEGRVESWLVRAEGVEPEGTAEGADFLETLVPPLGERLSNSIAAPGGLLLGEEMQGNNVASGGIIFEQTPVPGTDWILCSAMVGRSLWRGERQWLLFLMLASLLVGAVSLLAYLMQRAEKLRLRREAATTRQLQERETFFRGIFATSNLGLAIHRMIYDQEGRGIDYVIEEANPAFEKHTGLRIAEMVGKPISETLPGILKTSLPAIYGEVGKTGEPRDLVFYSPPLDRHFEISVFSIGPGLVAALFRDVTELESAKEELLLKSAALEHAANAIVITDREANVIWANPAFEELSGYSVAEVIGKNPRQFMKSGVHDAEFYKNLWETILSGETWVGEMVNRHRDGTLYTEESHITAVRDQQGEISHFVAIKQDITARKRSEAATVQQASNDAAAIEIARMMLEEHATLPEISQALLDSARRLTRSEAGLIAVSQKPDGPMTVQAQEGDIVPAGLLTEGPWSAATRMQSPVADNQPSSSAGYRNLLSVPVCAGQELLGLMVLANRQVDYDGEAIRSAQRLASLFGFHLRNETTRRRLAESEAQFRQAQKMEAVGRLAGGVAHDFNNMLQVILGHSEMAMLRCEDPALAKDLQEILHAAEHSAELTKQLLAFARKQPIAPRVIDMNHAIESLLKMVRRLLSEDIELIWEPGDALGKVLIDPTQVGQILTNLVVNARDALKDGGTIWIRTANVLLTEEFCQQRPGSRPGRHVCVEVEDNGVGMSEEVKAHVFEPFFSTKGQAQGTGLGLSTVYGILKQNEGFVDLESTLGKGTRFSLYFPITAADYDSVPDLKQFDTPAAKGGETILLVEDEPPLLQLGISVLESLGYHVLATSHPREALALAQGNGVIDLLVTDVVMPEMSGRLLCEQLRARTPDLRCLYMSGYTADIIGEHGVLEKGTHFLQKPFTVSDLGNAVRRALDK